MTIYLIPAISSPPLHFLLLYDHHQFLLIIINHHNTNKQIVTPEIIASIVSRWTGIPVNRLTSTERQRLLALGDRIKQKVVGQDDAVEAVAEAILRTRAGLGKPNSPPSFLLLGPTGELICRWCLKEC